MHVGIRVVFRQDWAEIADTMYDHRINGNSGRSCGTANGRVDRVSMEEIYTIAEVDRDGDIRLSGTKEIAGSFFYSSCLRVLK